MKYFFYLFFLSVFLSCASSSPKEKIDYRAEMRSFVIEIAEFARKQDPDFIVIPQNGHDLLVKRTGEQADDYLSAIDGVGQESLIFGYDGDNTLTPQDSREYLLEFLRTAKRDGKTVLVTDYTDEDQKIKRSYERNSLNGFISFSAPERELTYIPDSNEFVKNENNRNINSLSDAKNFLYLLNYENYDSKDELLSALSSTNFDVFIMDAFFHSSILTKEDLDKIRIKAYGGKRLLISYMSIGEAEDYRFYWKSDWNKKELSWIDSENPNWPGNFKVKYWNKDWKKIIYGNDNSYTQRILDTGFDGVYLDIIDGFWYFENKSDLAY
ncbi:MAG: endo alpha-1,4 polygalactosaminidase [Balneola sp.]